MDKSSQKQLFFKMPLRKIVALKGDNKLAIVMITSKKLISMHLPYIKQLFKCLIQCLKKFKPFSKDGIFIL